MIVQKKLILFVAMLTVSTAAWGQLGKIYGTVTFQGAPSSFEIVQLMDGQSNFLQRKLTDSSGRFAFEFLEPGIYKVVVMHEYQIAKEIDVTLSPNEYQALMVEVDQYVYRRSLCLCIPTVIVRPIRISDLQSEAIFDMQLDRNPFSMLASLNAGVYQADLGDPIHVRGARESSTTTFVDGVKLRGELNLPLAAIQRVEMVSAGMSAEYGDATGAVVLVTTKSPRKMAARNQPYSYWSNFVD